MREQTRAMISSGTSVFAERSFLEAELGKAFDHVTLAPEHSIAGTPVDGYLDDARDANFMVVLLTQDPRKAVENEVRAALDAGVHVAGFALHYPPFLQHGQTWKPTPEEKLLLDKRQFVREVKTLHELLDQTWRAIGHYISIESSRVAFTTRQQSYRHFADWLSGRPRRIAVVQTTSMLLLGARKTNPEEARCIALIRKLASGPNRPQILHLFDRARTLEAARQNHDSYIRNGDVTALLARTSGARPSIQLASSDKDVYSAVVVDDHVALSTPLGDGGEVMSLIRDARSADLTFDMIRRNTFRPLERE